MRISRPPAGRCRAHGDCPRYPGAAREPPGAAAPRCPRHGGRPPCSRWRDRPNRVQRLADQFVHRARPVELRGVDVVHPGRDGRAQHPQRLVAIPRRPEDPVAGSCIAPYQARRTRHGPSANDPPSSCPCPLTSPPVLRPPTRPAPGLALGPVQVHRPEGDRSSPGSGDLQEIWSSELRRRVRGWRCGLREPADRRPNQRRTRDRNAQRDKDGESEHRVGRGLAVAQRGLEDLP